MSYSYDRRASAFGPLTLKPPTGAPKLEKGQRVKIIKRPNVIKDDVGKVGEFQGYMKTQGAVVKIDGKEKLFPGSALKKVSA